MITDRIYAQVPNCAFRSIVIAFAVHAGRVVLTLQDQHAALINYIEVAKRLN